MSEKSAAEKCLRSVLQKSAGEGHCRELLEKSVVEKCWGRVL